MALSTIRRKLKEKGFAIERVENSDTLFRLKDISLNVYCGGYDCYYSLNDLLELASDDDN